MTKISVLLPEDFSAFTCGFQYPLEQENRLQLDCMTCEGDGQTCVSPVANLKLTTRKLGAEGEPVSEIWIVNTVDFCPSGNLSRREITK